jgi:hypothetical protein
MTEPEPATLASVVDEARRLLEAAEAQSVGVRLIGGVAVSMRAGDRHHPALTRTYADIDLVTTKGKGREVRQFLETQGYVGNVQFNAIHGHSRMLFYDMPNQRQLDVFVGSFSMCHTIPLGDRILVEHGTVPLAELLLTKLQVVQLNEKDLRDILALLAHHEVAETDGDTINAAWIARLLADDWGLWRTSKLNIERAREGVGGYDLDEETKAAIADRLDRLWARIEAEPKSRGWRLRDRIGDRKRWYEEPEEVG